MLHSLNLERSCSNNPFQGKISIKGKQWSLAQADDKRIERLVNTHGLPEIIARLLVLRDLDQINIEAFFNPKLSKHFPDPFALKNMDEASNFLSDAIIQNKKIAILADFDVDGATSCAVLKGYLKEVGCDDVPFFIPDRLNDGYGPSIKGFDYLKEQGADVVIVLDCGITSIEAVQHAKNIGLKTIIVDHHEPDSHLPVADFIINPKQKDCNSGYDYMAAVGVTFLLTVGLNAKLRQNDFFKVKNEPSMRNFMDLVALGTVCDMVPLVEANRLFVKHGFVLMADRKNHGLRALLAVSNITSMPDPYHAGFMLGPRINAGSRVHHSDLGAKLLSSDCEEEAMRIAWLLDDCNEKRKSLQKEMTREAMEKAKTCMIEEPNTCGLVLDGEGWHTGISGLVAGAIKDKYEKPTCVIAYVETEEGILEGRASGRSMPGVHLAEIFMDGQREGLLIKGGGHAMAGGFTILKENVDNFRNFFNKQINNQLQQSHGNTSKVQSVDTCLAVRSLNIPTAKLLLESLAPFGMGNLEPVTVLSNVYINNATQVGANHLRCSVNDVEGSVSLKAMAFRALDNDLGKLLKNIASSSKAVHLFGQVKINEWQGRESVEFHISDAMEA